MNDLIVLLLVSGAVYWYWRQRRSAPDAAAPPSPIRFVPRPRVMHEPPRLLAERTEAVLDGFTGAPLDLGRPLWRCTHCSACYEDASRDMLQAENGGRCLSCNTASLARYTAPSRPPPRIAAAPEPTRYRDGPVTITLQVRWVGPAADPGYFVAILEDMPWRQALKLIFPPAVSRRPDVARLIGALDRRRVTVAGRLTTAGPLGPRIVVTDPAMLRAIHPPLATP
jgi:hypothetical protein